MTEPRLLRGGCECEAVEYEVADAIQYALCCHCSNCRASTGSMFKPFGGIDREQLRVLKGSDTLLVWGSEDGNHTRCGICGSLLFSVVGSRVHVAYGPTDTAADRAHLRRVKGSVGGDPRRPSPA